MKFNCDRCKTRYSISDERVRGKILKIRCKNCSAVITVREGMTVAAPKLPAEKSAPAPLPRAPTPAPVAKPPPPPTPPPPPMVVEWFVSIDGDQAGPFDLAGAKRWVEERPAKAELYCWSEGFDDWLPVEKVSHFRGLRRPNGGLGREAVADPSETTPAPLFAETMKQMTAEAPTLLEDENPFSAAYERKKRETAAPAPSLGAPSPPIGRPPSARPLSALPPIGDEGPIISGLTMPETPRPEVLQPARRHPLVIPLIAATVVLLIVLGVLIYLALGGDDGGSSEEVTRTGTRSASLAQGFDDRPRPGPGAAAVDAGAPVGTAPARRDRAAGEAAAEAAAEKRTYTAPAGEVDLGGVGRSHETVKQGSLDPDDIAAVYRKKQFSVNRCYENAIKRDPLLEVPKTYITLEISTSGRVTKVSIPTLSGKPLGSCLVASITRWSFPASTEGFAGRFPIVFRSR